MALFKNKYRIESNRCPNWDYSSPGYYFITICTKNRKCIFGEIKKFEIILSEIGKIVEEEWLKSFEIRKELECDLYVIMPNHIHAIVGIIEQTPAINDEIDITIINNHNNDIAVETNGRYNIVETNRRSSLRQYQTKPFIRKPRSISSFIAGFKSATTKRINELRNTPGEPIWQPNYHDHIIRNEKELKQIREYIIKNPFYWEEDELYLAKELTEEL